MKTQLVTALGFLILGSLVALMPLMLLMGLVRVMVSELVSGFFAECRTRLFDRPHVPCADRLPTR